MLFRVATPILTVLSYVSATIAVKSRVAGVAVIVFMFLVPIAVMAYIIWVHTKKMAEDAGKEVVETVAENPLTVKEASTRNDSGVGIGMTPLQAQPL